ncbi:PREDICTED: craniofacial development protein 2-like [Trachymyrmex septentrionalis]|nr:PREDICTED: craniofacial development protein 2-like [Trachymyrmex septentrionalis]
MYEKRILSQNDQKTIKTSKPTFKNVQSTPNIKNKEPKTAHGGIYANKQGGSQSPGPKQISSQNDQKTIKTFQPFKNVQSKPNIKNKKPKTAHDGIYANKQDGPQPPKQISSQNDQKTIKTFQPFKNVQSKPNIKNKKPKTAHDGIYANKQDGPQPPNSIVHISMSSKFKTDDKTDDRALEISTPEIALPETLTPETAMPETSMPETSMSKQPKLVMDSSGVKFSGGKLVLRSDLRVGTTSGNSCRIKSKNGRDIKVGTWNVRSLYRPGAFQSMVGEVEKYGVEVVALQETRWAGEGSLNAGSYTLHYGGSEIHSLGIGFMINRKILSAVKDIKFINERLGLLVVQGRWYKIAIINVHAPTEDKDGEIKDGFYEELEHLVDQLPNDYMKIVVGDFNAKIGKEDIFRPTIGLESLHEESNDNGVRVINFATGKNLIVKSTYFKHKNIHKQTWISPDGGTRNQIDHVLADKRRHTNVLDVRSYRGADCDSDHLFVIAKIRERLSLNKTNGQLFGTKRLNVQGLIEGENGIKYAVEVTNRLAASKEIDESDDNTVDKH